MRLHLGSGKNILSDYINIDSTAHKGVDVVRDVLRGIPFNDSYFDEVLSENFMEHIPQAEVVWLMNEIWRVLKEGGTAHHVIPHAGTLNRWQDPTHLSDWIPETFRYFDVDNPKNQYYDYIKPWKIVKLEVVNSGQSIDVLLKKTNQRA